MIYLISDTHFGHANIIPYCKRPFESLEKMDQILIDNWNRVVKPSDTVYHLGDVKFGRGSESISYYLSKLMGNIILIKGSHDSGEWAIPMVQYLGKGGFKFVLTHDPDLLSPSYLSLRPYWVIHGHTHDQQPFLNYSDKRLNVSVEVIGYKPIGIDEVIDKIIGGVSLDVR